MKIDQELLEQACDWHAALSGYDPDFEGFTAWLEASPEHVRAYDAVMLADGAVADQREDLARAMPANDADEAARPASRRGWLGAAAVIALALPASLWFYSSAQHVEYRSGETTTEIAFDARTRVALDRHSVLLHDKRNAGTVELAEGAAHFDVHHDPSRRFTVMAGDVAITDLGTKFEVQRNAGQVSVQVAQGSVSIALPGQKAVTIGAGQRAYAQGGSIRVASADSGTMASWREGRLIYRDAPLGQVAREIGRYAPSPVIVDADIADRRFSGVLTIGDGKALDTNLAAFMGLARSDEGRFVRLSARN